MLPLRPLVLVLVAALALAGCTSDADVARETPGATRDAPEVGTPADDAAAPTLGGPARLEATSIFLDKATVAPGETFTFSAIVRNLGGETGEATLEVVVDDQRVGAQQVTLRSGETGTFSFPLSLAKVGDHTLTLRTKGAAFLATPVTLRVEPPGQIAIESVEVLPRTLELGDVSLATVTLRNLAELSGSAQVALKVGSAAAGTKTVQIDGQGTAQVSFSITPATGGVVPVEASLTSGNSVARTNVTVRAPTLANGTGWHPHESFCQKVPFTASFDNAGPGAARDVEVQVVVRDVAGAEKDRRATNAGDVLPGAHADVPFTLDVMGRCTGGPQTYVVDVVATPRFGEPLRWTVGPFNV